MARAQRERPWSPPGHGNGVVGEVALQEAMVREGSKGRVQEDISQKYMVQAFHWLFIPQNMHDPRISHDSIQFIPTRPPLHHVRAARRQSG